MQRILDIKITSHKNYGEKEIFSHDVATALRRLIYLNNVKKVKTIETEEGSIETRNGTVITWKHSYKNIGEKD